MSIRLVRERLLVCVLPVFCTAYLVYGFSRPYIARRMRREIEDEEEDEEALPGPAAPG